jgi:hypothetical protein
MAPEKNHESSRDFLKNSCPELDLLAELARQHHRPLYKPSGHIHIHSNFREIGRCMPQTESQWGHETVG